MRKLKVYLETSVWNFYFAEDAPVWRDITRSLLERVQHGDYDTFVGPVVFEEIGAATPAESERMLRLIATCECVKLEETAEVERLAEIYLSRGALPRKARNDALHVAMATVTEMDAIVSWNMRHIASLTRESKVRGINLEEGYRKEIRLTSPVELAYE